MCELYLGTLHSEHIVYLLPSRPTHDDVRLVDLHKASSSSLTRQRANVDRKDDVSAHAWGQSTKLSRNHEKEDVYSLVLRLQEEFNFFE